VPVVFGTDLLGHMHERQNTEFALRREVQSPVEILQGATIEAARLMRQVGHIGEIVPGAWADLLVVEGDPSADLGMLEHPEPGIRLIMKQGRVVKDQLRP
jgi:imidazolonepropionase-like amidohydrolase